MTNEGMTTQGLGHQIRRDVSGRNALEVDLLALNCISNEVKLDSQVTSPERCLSRCGNLQAGLIILSNEGGSSKCMTELGQ